MDAITEVNVLDTGIPSPGFLKLSLVLLSKAIEVCDYEPGIRAIVDKQTRRPDPGLQVVERQGYVLGVISVEDPDFARGCGLRNAVAIVVKEDSLVAGIAPEGRRVLSRLFCGRVEQKLVARAHTQLLILRLQRLSNLVHGCVAWRLGGDGRVYPALFLGTWVRLDNVGRIDANVEAEGENGRNGLEAVTHPPFLDGESRVLVLGVAAGFMLLVGVVHEEVLRATLVLERTWHEAPENTHRGEQIAVLFRVQLVVPAVADLEVAVDAALVGGALWGRDGMTRPKVALGPSKAWPGRRLASRGRAGGRCGMVHV